MCIYHYYLVASLLLAMFTILNLLLIIGLKSAIKFHCQADLYI